MFAEFGFLLEDSCSKLWYTKMTTGLKGLEIVDKNRGFNVSFPSHQMTPKILCICINSISPKENTFYDWEIRQLYYTTGARNFDGQNLALFWLLPCLGSIFFLGPESKKVAVEHCSGTNLYL